MMNPQALNYATIGCGSRAWASKLVFALVLTLLFCQDTGGKHG